MRLDELNRESLLACCGSEVWVERMLASRPFHDAPSLHREAEAIWLSLTPEEWLKAFAKHPKIGGKPSSAWSAQEQKGMSDATQHITQTMRDLNERYERKFGWIFIICATGKSAEEMRNLVEQRLLNDPERELQIAVDEQSKIMHLRLDKLLAE